MRVSLSANLIFLVDLHCLHAVLLLSLLFLMDVDVPIRRAGYTVAGVSVVCAVQSFPLRCDAGPGSHRTTGPVNAASLAQLHSTCDTTPGYRGGRHEMGYTAVKQWCDNDVD